MRYSKTLGLFLVLSLMSFSACGDSGSTDTPKGPDMSVATMEDLPNCTEKREGVTALVAEDNATYECKSGKWILVSAPMQTVESLDDLLACVAKREGSTSYITKEHTLYRCEDGSWEKMITFMDDAKTKDDLPNCTEKREGNNAFVTAERVALICSGGMWLPYDIYKETDEKNLPESSSGSVKSSSGQKIESSSSKDSKPNGEKYDCSVYKCVTTEYLNQEMLAAGKYGELLDVRDSQVYRTIQIGEQIWMAQNLNYASVNGNADHGKTSFCYDGSVEKCDKYGRIYSWTASANVPSSYSTSIFVSEERNKGIYQGICPEGFHIPQASEVETLLAYAGVISPAGLLFLSSDSLWMNSKAENVFGLSILPSGWLTDYKSYVAEGRGVRFWLALDDEHTAAYVWGMSDDDVMKGFDFAMNYQRYSFYVRCLKDDAPEQTEVSSSSQKIESSSSEVPKSSSSQKIASSSSVVPKSSSGMKSSSSSEVRYGTLKDSRDGKTYKTVTIGSQTWMAENLNFETDSSFCYNNEGSNCTKYGRLYRWAAAVGKSESECGYGYTCSLPSGNIQGVCPSGWHLPSQTEWKALLTAVGDSSTAGRVLKSTSGWNGNGTGTDAFGFSAFPAGERENGGKFDYEGYFALFWSSTEDDSNNAYYMRLLFHFNTASLNNNNKYYGFSVRCVKDEEIESSSSCKTASTDNCVYGSLTDSRDGQTYKTVTIDSQTWMAENLNYRVDSSFCYKNEGSNCTKYGRLYRWAAAVGKSESKCGGGHTCSLPSGNIRGVCPSGWHLPSSDEWNILFTAVGGKSTAAKVLKSMYGWPDYEDIYRSGTDAFGFSALPAGDRCLGDDYRNGGYVAYFWTSTEANKNYNSYSIEMSYDGDAGSLRADGKDMGYSVRCVRD